MTAFVRFQAPTPNARGHHPGIFALVNGLAADGLLSADEEAWRRAANSELTAMHPDPTTVDPLVYDRARHPGAAAWFRASAVEPCMPASADRGATTRAMVPQPHVRRLGRPDAHPHTIRAAAQ